IAVADVEADRIAEDEIKCAILADIFCFRADDDREFHFEICLMLGKGDLDRAVVRKKRAWRFEPNQWSAERRPFHLRDVIGVVEPDRDQLRRRDWKIDIYICELCYFACRGDVDPKGVGEH